MYSREVLLKYIEAALNGEVPSHVVSELMDELDQVAVKFEGDEVSSDDVAKYLKDDEVFTDNPNYRQGKDFSLFDSSGKLICTVYPDKTIEGKGALTFTIPCGKDDEETKQAFVDFCDRLQRNSAVVFPYEGDDNNN